MAVVIVTVRDNAIVTIVANAAYSKRSSRRSGVTEGTFLAGVIYNETP
jgi:hypothetical protein